MLFRSGKRDEAFFLTFREHASTLVGAAKTLVSMFDDLGARERLNVVVHDAERKGDDLTREMVRRLHGDWLTPIDHYDALSLISRLDDVLDHVEAIADSLVLFDIAEAKAGARELASVLHQACERLEHATTLMPGLKTKSMDVLRTCEEIGRLERQADGVYRRAVADLFRDERDAITVLKWRHLLDNLEDATDRCEDAANVIEGVVLENG